MGAIIGKGNKSLKRMFSLLLVMFLVLPGVSAENQSIHGESSVAVAQRAEVSAFRKPVDPNVSYAALQSNLAVLGADALAKGYGIEGTGQTVGIVDTGVDPLIPGFLRTGGTPKIVKWLDLTLEGRALILGKYTASGGQISVQNVRLKVADLKSTSGTFVVGTLPGIISEQLSTDRDIYFVAHDPNEVGVYEAITVDTDGDLDFHGETTVYEYNASKTSVRIPVDSRRSISLVISSIDPRGNEIVFGFDLHGHGTGMASIVSGYSKGQGGVAPDADLVVAKAVSSTGYGSWDTIIRGIEYCLNNNASVVLVGAVSENPISEVLWGLVEKLAQSKGAHIVMAAGNKGPGVGTLTIGSTWPGLIISSGYFPTATFNAIFGRSLSHDTFYPYSTCGPDLEGNRGIDVMASAIAPVPEPGYHKTLQFVLMDGTSVSAAYTAGAVALLRQGAIRFGLNPLEGTTLSLLEGANTIDRLTPVEQGYGKINLVKAWSLLGKGINEPKLRLVRKWMGDAADQDIWIKGNRLGAFPFWVDNFAPTFRHVNIETTKKWLDSQSEHLDVMPVAQRGTVIYGLGELCPGFHSGEILADDPSTLGVDGRMAVNVSIPHEFSQEGKAAFPVTLGVGENISRHFLRVPDSAERLSLSMDALGFGTRFGLYNPDGILVDQGWIEDSVTCRVGLPKAGLWQVCFYKDPQDKMEGRTAVAVTASLDGVSITDLGAFGGIHQFAARADETLPITLSFISPNLYGEQRVRESRMIPTKQATILSPVDVGDGIESICLRFGTNSVDVVRGYVYHLDEALNKWVEIESSVTGDNCVGQICINDPPKGRYLASVEGYSQNPSCYAEIDYLVVKAGQSVKVPQVTKVNSLGQKSTAVRIETAEALDSPGIVVVRRGIKGSILGVIERAGAFQPTLVQLSGTGALRTIRAFETRGLAPVDAYVTVGDAAYQLHGGRITVPTPPFEYGQYRVPGSKGVFLFGQ